METTTENEDFVEKSFLILLLVITVTQFAVWGQQSVRFILTTIFPVEGEIYATPIDAIIGFGAMIASALVFAGAVMWWKKMPSAFSLITKGSILFVFKNILDIFNEIVLFGIETSGDRVNMDQIDSLAAGLGNQFFQLAFWVFIFFYFKHKITKHVQNGRTDFSPEEMRIPEPQQSIPKAE